MKKKGLLSVKIPGLSKTIKEKPAENSAIRIDYPQEGETVYCGHYAIRMHGGTGESQVSINGGAWQDCRNDAGFSWYDWFPATPGTHHISFRTRMDGKWAKAERDCEVK